MAKSLTFLALLACAWGTGVKAEASAPGLVEVDPSVRSFIKTYCTDCHNPDKLKGDLDLISLSVSLDNSGTAQYWQDILDVLNLGEMPPENKPQPSSEEMTAALESLTHSLVAARKAMADTGGRLVSRRLNKREYVHFVGELLGVAVDPNLLPDDDRFEGFDTVGAAHSLTGFHIERYLNTARDALGKLQPEVPLDSSERVDLKNRQSAEKTANAYHEFKALYESGERKHPEMDAEIFRRETPTNRRTYKEHYLTQKNLHENFERLDEGYIVNHPRAGHSVMVDMEGRPAGKYILRARIAAAGKNQDEGRYVGLQRRSVSENPLNGSVSYFHVSGTMTEPEVIEMPIEYLGFPTEFIMRCRQTEEPATAEYEDYMKPFMKNRLISWYEEGLWVDWIELVGPLRPNQNRYDDVFFQGIEPSGETAEGYARQILHRFAERAFRGKTPAKADIESALKFYHMAKSNSESFEGAVKEAMAYLMVSPQFLYAIEAGEEKVSPLSSRELANRLALFLWSSLPDAELIETAKDDSLLSETVLLAQVDRMLADPKAETFYHHFMDQWMGLHEVESVAFPDDYKRETLESAKAEPIETYKHLVKENLSLLNLIESDFVVVNALLAEFYGIDGVKGNEFRPVKVPEDSIRGGLLGMSSILGMGGDGEKSLPIKRGAFVAAKIIDRHPPSPPPNVPLIKVDGRQSIRKLFEDHSNKPACASCHQRFDSFGFALESFDELGRWRTEEVLGWKTVVGNDGAEKMVRLKTPISVPIQTHGVLEDGTTAFADYQEMISLLAANRGEQFAGGMIRALIK
ncbi:MAG: DUF1592 domain-containing protein, partial [Verrucomicrobiota bacterium]